MYLEKKQVIKKGRTRQFRNFVFTCANYTNEDKVKLERFECNYIIFVEQLTANLQGYCELKKRKSISKLYEIFDNFSIETRKQSVGSCIAYYKKLGNFIERGIPSQQGKRNDLLLRK